MPVIQTENLEERVNVSSTHPFNFFRMLKLRFLQGYEVSETAPLILTPSFLSLEMTRTKGDDQ